MAKRPTRYYSKKQENLIAKELGGNRQPNSGATMFSKGDVVLDDWLIEAKTKTSPSSSMTIHREWLEKNEEEAFAMGKQHSALVFDFGDIHYPQEYVIITLEEFKKLLEASNES
jgi:hypothetical protein